MKKLFVGSLPFATKEEELKDFFSQVGAVESVAIIMDKMTGRSKGFGFVEMSSEEEAQKAVDTLNGTDFGGRNIVVNIARPKEDRPAGGFGGGRGGYNRN